MPANNSLVHDFLEESARRFPDKTAIIQDGVRASYDHINRGANRIARALLEMGLVPGDRVTLIMHNSPEYVMSYYAVLKAGGVAVSLSVDTKPDGLRPILEELKPRAVISSHRFETLLKDTDLAPFGISGLLLSAPKMAWEGSPFPALKLEDITAAGESSDPGVPVTEKSLASIIYTSGSTGKPKGVMLTHGNIVCNTDSICQYLHLTSDDIQMAVLPFHYVMGKSLLNTHFAVGGTVVLNNKFAFTASVIKQMAEEKVTGFSGVPSTYAYLLHRSPLKSYRDRLPSLRYCSQAGGHMARKIKEELIETLPSHTAIYIMYGATEASARLTYLEPSMLKTKIESIGKAIPGVTMRVLDDKGNDVPAGQTGEMVASGPNIMQGYWKDPQATAAVLDNNGYHTGDLGYFDEDGYLYTVGRKDNLLKVGGHRLNPQDIEDAIMDTGLVMEAAVVGLPDELLGNRLVAVATPIDNACKEDDIARAFADKLPKYKHPGTIMLVKNLPKNAHGKVSKKECIKLAGEMQKA